MDALPRVPVRPTHSRTSSQADVVADFAAHAAASASGGAVAAHAGGRAGGGGGGGTSSGGFPLTPASSQPGTPLAGTLPGIPSGDGSGSEGDGGHGAAGGGDVLSHPRAPSRLGAASRVSGGTGAHGAAGGGGSGGTASSSGPLERLRQVAGNRRCADCGAQDPDWASLNLGVLLCIECSGVHRQLGVQVSKVRSCTLDVKVWEPAVIAVFQAVGNDASNKVWEAGMPASGAAAATAAGSAAAGGGGTEAAAARAADSWVWCDDDSGGEDEEGRAGGGARGPRGSASGRRQVGWPGLVDGFYAGGAACAAVVLAA
jgi:Arf-GAP/coiled-coil/ANK repeat/PH domain-containing protein